MAPTSTSPTRTGTRLALILVALAISGYAVSRLLPGDDEPTPVTEPAPETSGEGEAFDPHGIPGPRTGDGAPLPIPKIEDIDPMPKRDPGPKLADGTPVPVRITYKPGTESEYVLTEAMLQRNRDDGASVAQRFYTGFSMKVMTGGSTPRIRLSMDWFRVQAIYPNDFQFDFDSREPDERLLDDEIVGSQVKPFLAVLGMPVEVTLGADGTPTEIDGLERWEEEWTAAVEFLSAGQSRKMESPYAVDDVVTQWIERFFPPLGTDPIPAGTPRDFHLRRVTPYAHYVTFDGGLTSTHDADGIFRVAALADVGKERRQGTFKGHAAAIEKVHVQADESAYSAAWRFDREAGRLVDAEIDVKYQIWPSWRRGQTATGQSNYEARFLDIERSSRVELVEE